TEGTHKDDGCGVKIGRSTSALAQFQEKTKRPRCKMVYRHRWMKAGYLGHLVQEDLIARPIRFEFADVPRYPFVDESLDVIDSEFACEFEKSLVVSLGLSLEESGDEGVLAWEVLVHRTGAHSGNLGDSCNGRGLQPAVGEHSRCRFDDRVVRRL